MHKENTEVLVVGAGPVGMLTALALKRAGIHVRILDQEQGTTTHSHACALHSDVLQLLSGWDLADEIVSEGHRINTIAFYDKAERRTEVNTRELRGDFPYIIVFPQRRLEEMLERKLEDNGVNVEWSHRLATFEQGEEKVVAQVDRLRESAKAYAVPYMDWEVVKSFELSADFLVGADGHNSHVRQILGIKNIPVGPRQTFAICQFESHDALDPELRVILSAGASVLWPLPDNRCRWTFEITDSTAEEFPAKERSHYIVEEPSVNRERRDTLQAFLNQRARWFHGLVEDIDWAETVQFEPSLVERFGEGRCWLVGDAAHQAGPIGVQSMNVGLREGTKLAGRLSKVVRGETSTEALQEFAQECRDEWQQLLGIEKVKTGPETQAWIQANAQQMVSCLPASGHNLAQLLGQMEIEFQPRTEWYPVR